MADKKHPVYLDDKTRGRQGTLEEIIEDVEPSQESEFDDVCQIKYNPSTTPGGGIKNWLKTIFPFFDNTVITDQKFPRKSVYRQPNNASSKRLPGEPEEFLVIDEDELGNKEHSERIGEQREKQISTVQKQRDNLRRKVDEKTFENMDSQKEENDDKKRGGRRSSDEEWFNEREPARR